MIFVLFAVSNNQIVYSKTVVMVEFATNADCLLFKCNRLAIYADNQ